MVTVSFHSKVDGELTTGAVKMVDTHKTCVIPFKGEKIWKCCSIQCFSIAEKVHNLRQFVAVVRTTCKRRLVGSIGEMITTGENESTGILI